MAPAYQIGFAAFLKTTPCVVLSQVKQAPLVAYSHQITKHKKTTLSGGLFMAPAA